MKRLTEAREEKGDLEKTYRYTVHKIKKLQEKLANHHIENEAIIHPKELPQTKQFLEKQLAEARKEKGDLEKTYHPQNLKNSEKM